LAQVQARSRVSGMVRGRRFAHALPALRQQNKENENGNQA